ncbi:MULTISPECIES: helix-turn-helix domain-containing protein [Streptomyces]|uniref:helix-turn-helix domain-containing protein n=1 Tax=Streptomyces TaxID=1883 RepID=UPI00186B17E2|nr:MULTISPECIES: helix-turn-helix domain-containing protein [Streptomyces]
MRETVYSGEGRSGAERFERWRQAAFASHNPCELLLERPEDFDASLRVLDLGAVWGTSFRCPPMTSARTARLIRQADPELLYLAVPRRGRIAVDHADGQLTVDTGQLLVMSSSYPYRARLSGGDDAEPAFALDDLLVPRALLPASLATCSPSVALCLPSDLGLGGLLSQFLTQLVDDADAFRPASPHTLGTVAVDLVGALLSAHLDRPLPPEERERALTLRVHAFVQRHLAEPDLSPAHIAAAHHLSVRSLHRLFQRNGTTVRSFLRGQRLERARRALRDPASAQLPIAAIARRHGFVRPADFTRAFRAAYGQPPSDYREAALRGAIGCGGS